MDFSRYEKLRTLVRANFSEQTQALVDEALVYADGKLASLTRYDGSPLLTHAAAVAGIVISEVGLGRNSTISAILHDVVRLAHKQLPAEEFLALTADIRSRFGEQVVGITIGMCQHLGTETEGRQGAGREFPRPARLLLRRPPRHPHQAGRPARSDALAGDLPAREVAQEELGSR